MKEKIIPQDIEAEQSVLSAMLIDKKAVGIVAEKLKPEDFYRPAHQIIYRTILSLHAKNEPADLVTVTHELKKQGKLKDVGDVLYITLLADIVPTAANVKYHAQIVEEKAVLRQMIESGTAIAAMGYEGADEIQCLIDKAEKSLLRLSYRKSATDFVPIQEIVTATVDRIGEMAEGHDTTGLRTGFADLDELTGGLHPSDFIILAARPSMGKTALALNIAQNAALRGAAADEKAKRVAFFSLEMSRDQLVQRMICTEADVDMLELRPKRNGADAAETEDASAVNGEAVQDEAKSEGGENDGATVKDNVKRADGETGKMELLNRIWVASDKLANSSVFIDDTPGLTIQELRSKARRLKAGGGLDLVVIDYLQLMQASSGGAGSENRQHEVAEISRGLKALARELDVPVLALSQLSRSVETRQVKKPMLSDLRESGSLEQDADIVMFLYRDDYYKTEDAAPNHLTELIIAKHRNGPTGKVDLFFKNDCTKFVSLNERDA
jgi:replicative DNA helicase